ncbi:MAG: hypothetical protein WCP28_20290 [Actinomycetes bacterium]
MTTRPISAPPLQQLQPRVAEPVQGVAGRRTSRLRRPGKLNRCLRCLIASLIINFVLLGPVTFGLYHLVQTVPSAKEDADQVVAGASAISVAFQWLIATEWFVVPPSLMIGLLWLSPAMARKQRAISPGSSPAATPQSAGSL